MAGPVAVWTGSLLLLPISAVTSDFASGPVTRRGQSTQHQRDSPGVNGGQFV